MIGEQGNIGEKNISCKEKETILLKGSLNFMLIIRYSMLINNMTL